MKNMSNGAKFLIGCAAVFVLGAILTVGGVMAGGTDYFAEEVTKAPETETGSYEFSFKSVEATGSMDLVLVGSKYYDDVLDDYGIADTEPKAGKVIVIRKEDEEMPEVNSDGDKLVINGGANSFKIGEVDLFEPTVIVFCGDDELKSVKVSSEAADVIAKGVKFKTADIGLNAGEVEFRDVVSGGIRVDDNAGDIEVSGMLNGTTDLHTDAGEIDVDTADGIKSYTIDIRTDTGSIDVGEDEIKGTTFSQKGGDRILKLSSDAGDIEVGEK